MNIGIIGGGAIANFLLQEINEKKISDLHVTSVYIRNKDKYNELEDRYGIRLYTNIDEFLDSTIDIVVEAANIEAVFEQAPAVLKKKDLVLISIGALADETFYHKVNSIAEEFDQSIHLPTGAIGGLDLLQSAHALGGVEEVSLTTRKPATSLLKEPISQEETVFDGTAKEAIQHYPKNINVSIILSLAGVNMNRTNVKIIADPTVENNIHAIDIAGKFGSATFSVTNQPMETNPNTSYLAALSVLNILMKQNDNIKIGH